MGLWGACSLTSVSRNNSWASSSAMVSIESRTLYDRWGPFFSEERTAPVLRRSRWSHSWCRMISLCGNRAVRYARLFPFTSIGAALEGQECVCGVCTCVCVCRVCVCVCVCVCVEYEGVCSVCVCVGGGGVFYLEFPSELCAKKSVVRSSCVRVLTVDNGWENPL